ncbi:MAG: hypothetical protein ACI9YT_001455 [Halobacteriales archaeon]|jgi:hypothetical protein
MVVRNRSFGTRIRGVSRVNRKRLVGTRYGRCSWCCRGSRCGCGVRCDRAVVCEHRSGRWRSSGVVGRRRGRTSEALGFGPGDDRGKRSIPGTPPSSRGFTVRTGRRETASPFRGRTTVKRVIPVCHRDTPCRRRPSGAAGGVQVCEVDQVPPPEGCARERDEREHDHHADFAADA